MANRLNNYQHASNLAVLCSCFAIAQVFQGIAIIFDLPTGFAASLAWSAVGAVIITGLFDFYLKREELKLGGKFTVIIQTLLNFVTLLGLQVIFSGKYFGPTLINQLDEYFNIQMFFHWSFSALVFLALVILNYSVTLQRSIIPRDLHLPPISKTIYGGFLLLFSTVLVFFSVIPLFGSSTYLLILQIDQHPEHSSIGVAVLVFLAICVPVVTASLIKWVYFVFANRRPELGWKESFIFNVVYGLALLIISISTGAIINTLNQQMLRQEDSGWVILPFLSICFLILMVIMAAFSHLLRALSAEKREQSGETGEFNVIGDNPSKNADKNPAELLD